MEFPVSLIAVACFLGFCLSEEAEESFPRVITTLGAIEGYYKTSSSGRRYEAYEGIPYADPPIGELRFKVARSVSPWTGVIMAKHFSPSCIQYNVFVSNPSRKVEGSEDCLYMNIYTAGAEYDHNGEQTNLLPVIFYIHGGAFLLGSAVDSKSGKLIDKNVTLVTINYRLGPLGFLSTEDAVVPGNMGLKDQVIALRWVKDNIRSFGGDPSKITIFGLSAGGSSVHYHYLTNLTTGLFQRGMSLSGTALNSWAQTENSLEKTKALSTVVGCPIEDVQNMVDCLRTRPVHQIVNAVKIFTSLLSSPIPFGPVVEKGGGEFTFIDRPPIEIITSGKVHDLPWITGVVSEEGLCFLTNVITNDTILKEVNDNWEMFAPHMLDFNYTIPKIDHPRVARSIKEHYLGTSPIERSTINQTIQMAGDRLFLHDAQKAARLQAKVNQSPVRFYYFSYRGAHSFTESMTGSSENFGVSHTDDESYIWEHFFDPTTTPQDRAIQKKMINIWVSFASDGTPDVGVEWTAVNETCPGGLDYLHIAGPDEISMKTSLNFGDSKFWDSVGFQENENYVIEN